MASPLSTQLVEDLKQNFYWSYISEDTEHIELVNLEMTVAQFLEYIEIDLDGDPYSSNELVTLYYGMKEELSNPGVFYFTYLIVNSVIEEGIIVNYGIIGNEDEYLLLKEGSTYSVVNNAAYLTLKGLYESASIYSPYIDESTVIDSFTNHPLMCSFPKEDFKNFIKDNMSSPTMNLTTLSLVFQMGASFITGVNNNYKVETAIAATKDISGIRLDSLNYTDKPFKFKAMDVGHICPPQCGI